MALLLKTGLAPHLAVSFLVQFTKSCMKWWPWATLSSAKDTSWLPQKNSSGLTERTWGYSIHLLQTAQQLLPTHHPIIRYLTFPRTVARSFSMLTRVVSLPLPSLFFPLSNHSSALFPNSAVQISRRILFLWELAKLVRSHWGSNQHSVVISVLFN